MLNLVLLTPKHLIENNANSWASAIQNRAILFTGVEAKKYIESNEKIFNKIFEDVFYFENYHDSDLIEKKIFLLNKNKKIDKIVALSEIDILRAARIREFIGIQGQTVDSAMAFRDKYKMKRLAENVGMLTPAYYKVNNTIDLLKFIRQHRYPIVVKPIAGRGSSNTFIIKNSAELDKHLAQGIFSKFDCGNYLLVEKFINGNVYHIDGHILNKKLSFINPSLYVNNCLNFIDGSTLGSITLSDTNILKPKLIEHAKQLLFNALPTPDNTLFHIEFFVDANQDVYLCEAASRLGGGNINEQLLLAYGCDIKIQFIKSHFEDVTIFSGKQKTVAARLLIPPKKNSILKKIPALCPFDFVKSYQRSGIIGKQYGDITMSNQEIAHFLFESASESEALNRMQKLTHWFNCETEWESSEDGYRKIAV